MSEENICCCNHEHDHVHDTENKFYIRIDDTEECENEQEEECENIICPNFLSFFKVIKLLLMLLLIFLFPCGLFLILLITPKCLTI